MKEKECVVVIGSANIDFPILTPRLPLEGESLLVDRRPYRIGGKGITQATAAVRQGMPTRFFGCVGGDEHGKTLTDFLVAQGVDVRYLKQNPETYTGMALLLIDPEGKNRILSIPGANHEPFGAQKAAQAVQGAAYVLAQLEIHLPSLFAFIGQAGEQTRIILNPAPASEIPKELYSKLFLITPNETEAEQLCGVQIQTPGDARLAARKLREMGTPNVVITLGDMGLYALCDGFEGHLPAIPVDVVDTVGAGDALNGALAAALALGMPFERALVHANAAAALSITKQGSAETPTFAEVDAFLQKRGD
jgi:ribokinase